MEIRINGQLAALKKGTSFEFVAENHLFSGSDGYTLSITFPLRHCAQNLAIFGHLNRMDVIADKIVFDCEIRHRNFYKFGSITVTEINDAEVKTQFLEGRSELNFESSFDDIYINELSLGKPKNIGPDILTPAEAWDPVAQNHEAVALPWWNDSSDGQPHNFADYADGNYQWSETTRDLTWQPYLLYITKKICEVLEYTADFSKWEENDKLKYLLICNALPGAWDVNDYARALPHWTVTEYFEKLELFLGAEFTIDHRARHVGFAFTQQILRDATPITLDRVVDEHTVEVKAEDERCEYIEAKNLVYKECGGDMWKYYSCDWFIKAYDKNAVKYDTLKQLMDANKHLATWNGYNSRGSNHNKVLYAADVDRYFIIRTVDRTPTGQGAGGHNSYQYKCVLQPINTFGGRIVDDREDADAVEIEFVPARIDHTEDKYGFCLFLSFSTYSESVGGYRSDVDFEAFQVTGAQSMVLAGEKERKGEYYDCIYLGFWDGTIMSDGKLPHPYVEDIVIADDWSSYYQPQFSMCLNDRKENAHRIVHHIDPKKKMAFKFLADNIPDVRAPFIIKGKRYICEKVTATFTENGMSQLLKGLFYPIMD